MNKIYKVVWSKAKNCYVVANELAKSHTKAPNSKMISKAVTAGILACVMSCGAVIPVFAVGTDSYEAGGGSASGDYSVSIGKDTTATNSHTNSIGYDSSATAAFSSVFGSYSHVTGEYSFLIGNNSSIEANIKGATVFGNDVLVNNGSVGSVGSGIGEGVIAIGNNIIVSLNEKADNSRSSTSEGDPTIEHVVAIGDGAIIGEENAIGIGFQAKATALNSLAVGQGAEATGEGSTAIGENSQALGHFANAFGYQAKALMEGGAAFGQSAVASQKFGTAFGRQTKAQGEFSTAVGNDANAISQGAVAIGSSSIANGGVNTSTLAIGNGARTGKIDGNGVPTTGYGETVAIGGFSYVENAFASAIGSSANVTGLGGTALGSHASVTAQNAVALGYNAVANEANTVSLGTSSDKRRITNVADGTSATNAATVGQTVELVAGDNVTFGETTNSIGQKKITINSTATGGTDLHYIGVDGDDSDDNYNGEGASGYRAIAIGHDASADYQDAIAMGSNTVSDGDGSIAMGVMSQANGNNSLALMSQSRAIPDGAMAIGYLATAEGGDSVVIGTKASTTERSSSSVAIGNTASTEGQASIAIGGLAKAEVNNSVVIGLNAKSEAITEEGTFGAVVIGVNGITNNGVAIGSNTDATGNTSVAIGPKAKSLGNNSVALGEQSSTAEYQGIAIGYKAQSTSNSAVAIGGGSEASGSFASIAVGPNAKAQGGGVAIGTASRTYEYGSVAVGPNARVVRGIDNSVAIGMDSWAEEEGVVSFGTAAKNDEPEKTRRLLHVTAGIDDTDAVNVSQLREAVAGAGGGATYTAGNGIEISNENAISAKAGTNVTVDNNGISVAGNGTIADGNTGLISGDTLYDEVHVSNGNYIQANNTVAGNLTALDSKLNEVIGNFDDKADIDLGNIDNAGKTVIRNLAKESVKVVNGTNTNVTEGTDGTYKTYAVNVASDGTVTSGDTGIVTGGTVYEAIQNAINSSEGGTDTALAGKANVALDNVTDAGHVVIKTDAKSAINVIGNEDVTVSKTDVSGVDTYNVSVVKDGTITSGNEKLVTGGTVYTALQAEARPLQDGNYITTSNTAGENLTALDTQVKANADTIVTNTSDITNLKDLSNITEAGETVIKNLSKGFVNVVGGSYATVDKTDVNGVDTYTVNVDTNGEVSEGNDKLVTGGTVYQALANQQADVNIALEGKANVGLDNISPDGETVIRDLAKGSVKVVNGDNTTVVTGTDGNFKTYAVNVVANGVIRENDNGVVSGGTVYDALKNYTDDFQDRLDDKANVDASNVTDAVAWGNKIATGEVEANDKKAVSGGTV